MPDTAQLFGSTTGHLPEGFAAIPVSREHRDAPVRLCAIVEIEPKDGISHLIEIRRTLDARVILAALVDQAGFAHHWLELWLQQPPGLGAMPEAAGDAITNHILDQRWQARCRAVARLMPESTIVTGLEAVNPAPLLLDLDAGEPVHPVDEETGKPWQLCRDDAQLQAAGLPAYSTSQHWYLIAGDADSAEAESRRWIAITDDAPAGEGVQPLSALTRRQEGSDLVALNPGGGLTMARSFAPVDLEAFFDILSGRPWPGPFPQRTRLTERGPWSALASDREESPLTKGHLLLARRGRESRLLETLHLKLRLIESAARQVRRLVADGQTPLLNVRGDSFRVDIAPPDDADTGLPLLWTSRVRLADVTEAIVLPVPQAAAQYYLPPRAGGASIYDPQTTTEPVRGKSAVRIREIREESDDSVHVEGTWSTSDAVDPAAQDLIRLRLPVAGGLDLFIHLDVDSALAAGEWRFRSLPHNLPGHVVSALREREGVPMPQVEFDLVPLLSSPCDLYALAVLSARGLLVDDETTLARAVDEMHSLAHQLAGEPDAQTPLPQRIATVIAQDDRWLDALGPHRLTREPIEPANAWAAVPPDLWWRVLAMMVRALPGIGPDSTCAGPGDAPAGTLHRVFDPMIDDLAALVRRTRAMLVGDWHENQEIHEVVDRLLASTSSTGP